MLLCASVVKNVKQMRPADNAAVRSAEPEALELQRARQAERAAQRGGERPHELPAARDLPGPRA